MSFAFLTICFTLLNLKASSSVVEKNYLHCPCEGNPFTKHVYNFPKILPSLCILESSIKLSQLQFKSNSLNISVISRVEDSETCDVILKNKTDIHSHKYCPGECLPKPVIEIHYALFFDFPSPIGHIGCSTTDYSENNYLQISDFLEDIFWKRVQECDERRVSSIPPKYQTRQKVSSVFIWIGSVAQKEIIHAQTAVLRRTPKTGPHAVVAWLAMDDLYSCRNGTWWCDYETGARYAEGMPGTWLGRNPEVSEGYACAVRRPLRALAHVLLLYNPDTIFLGDDDTYVNYPLFVTAMQRLESRMVNEPIILGSGYNKFLMGGAGYIFGKNILSILADSNIKKSDHILSIVRQAERANLSSCELPCLPENTNNLRADAVISLKNGRLIDLCTNLLADEYTCHNSDHSIPRCLIHGAYATILHVPCGDASNNDPIEIHNRILHRFIHQLHRGSCPINEIVDIIQTTLTSNSNVVTGGGEEDRKIDKHILLDIILDRHNISSPSSLSHLPPVLATTSSSKSLSSLPQTTNSTSSKTSPFIEWMDALSEIFDIFDHDGTGNISLHEVIEKLRHNDPGQLTQVGSSYERKFDFEVINGIGQLCYRDDHTCNIRTDITCHRYRPVSYRNTKPLRTNERPKLMK